ncbi:MAG: TRAP transporter fused permease subunit, partial [Burkholderiales bacterium]|nr:TRAP transporter fused permease subunit [Burkholderiales bacterium]
MRTESTADQPNQALIDQVLAAESGARHPEGFTKHLIVFLAVAWSLFQLWISSPVPFWVSAAVPALQKFVMFNDTMARSIHLSFAIFLVYLAYPMWKRSPRNHVPIVDWLFAFVAAFCTSYLFTFHSELSTRPGSPTTLDIVVAFVGVVTLLEATRRCLGMPMTIMGIVFLVYMFAGQYMPDMISHKGASISRAASHQWLTTEGVFGVALGVSTSFVFLYVLFGAMLDKAGAGNYLTRVAFALMGHMRGGPAKAAVLSSGLNGMISGSSVANVLTGGNVTIMLMKRVGYSPVKAGAIEVASSSNGQIMPPVMGAAAFLMVEYVNIPYSEIIKHAFLPAILAYLSLLYIVHLEALKVGMVGLPRRMSPLKGRMLGWLGAIVGTLIIVQISLKLTEWIPQVFGETASVVVGAFIAVIYVGLVWYSARWPDTATDALTPESMTELPETMPT